MNLSQAKEVLPPLGVYCHVPFCASTCDFCAFYQEKPRREELVRYLDAMEKEFQMLPPDRPVDTVFWGGGTPGLLPAKDLERLGRAMLASFTEAPLEWTVEMAPSAVKADKLSVLRDLGVSRISMGVQSFDGELLESLGRLHRPKQIYDAWERIEEAGFEQTNLDLMFALPGQGLEQWASDIEEAVRLGPSHISTYCLTFEEDTALYVKLSKGELKIDESRELAFYERGWEMLESLGYAQYEVSNFSRPGKRCMHNVNTWRMGQWIGYGPSAASQYKGQRFQRPASLKAWSSAVLAGSLPKEGVVPLDDSILLADAVVFGLRMNEGVRMDRLGQQFARAENHAAIEALLHSLGGEGLLDQVGTHYSLTQKGRLLCDAVGSAILGLEFNP
ncbi:MAG: coproporphyrinogen III oxidase [Puniceicoccaceae bacterium MED-G30]|jgi:oxygen-independent coproporphyrinogen-3 oxidase|nr:MAG: coproporphyrinogen III oxidase [Puniceicoccaceae bacterium MED-G30]RPG83342.1 MAG: radical SAM family heme chaperone HemW [Coraliomargarita sp. TMED73]